MKNGFILPSSNQYEEYSEKFYQSKLAERLRRKYEPQPYEERYKAIFYSSLGLSYLCNVFSILTASTFVFSYFYSIFAELPSPGAWALIFTGSILIMLEALQRFLAPLLFRGAMQYGFSGKHFATIAALLALSGLSVFFNYNGGFDLVREVSSPPTYQEPERYDIEATKTEYRELIASADADAKNYRESKLYLGRLSDVHAREYRRLLDKKNKLQEALLAKVNEYEELNRKAVDRAKQELEVALAGYESKVNSKGGGLAGFTIVAQLVFFICIFFTEFYHYKTATQ